MRPINILVLVLYTLLVMLYIFCVSVYGWGVRYNMESERKWASEWERGYFTVWANVYRDTLIAIAIGWIESLVEFYSICTIYIYSVADANWKRIKSLISLCVFDSFLRWIL